MTAQSIINVVDQELRPKYSRVLLKLGGEMFGGGAVGLDPDVVHRVARQIAEAVRSGVQVAVVIGGGNFFRGSTAATWNGADAVGLHGDARHRDEQPCATGFPGEGRHRHPRPDRHHDGSGCRTVPAVAGRSSPGERSWVIFGAGMGLPYFSTDTTAAQRALEIGAEVVLMAKAVDGVFTDDPRKTRPLRCWSKSLTARSSTANCGWLTPRLSACVWTTGCRFLCSTSWSMGILLERSLVRGSEHWSPPDDEEWRKYGADDDAERSDEEEQRNMPLTTMQSEAMRRSSEI